MNTLNITSPEALDTAVAGVVRLKIEHTKAVAGMDAEIAAVQKRHAARLATLAEEITEAESNIMAYCEANRAALFTEKKSRDSAAAVIGFEFTPWRVETARRQIKVGDVLVRLRAQPWGKDYIRKPAEQLDKEALLADREKLTPEQLTAAGILFDRDEQFFIRPKSESAEPTTQPA